MMKKLYWAISVCILLILLALVWYFFSSNIIQIFTQGSSQQNIVQDIASEEVDEQVLSKEEQVEVLEELAPEELIDTEEEISEEVRLLDELQNQTPTESAQGALDQLNALQDQSVQEQLDLLEQLQN